MESYGLKPDIDFVNFLILRCIKRNKQNEIDVDFLMIHRYEFKLIYNNFIFFR